MIDYAHNEAGMSGLVETLDGLRPRGGQVWLAICTAGDRTERDPAVVRVPGGGGFGSPGGRRAPAVPRGRSREDIIERLQDGAETAGVHEVTVYPDELTALRAMVGEARPGDVVGVTALGMRPEIFAWLEDAGATRMRPGDVRRVVRRAQASRA